jgi:hypothetical protein
MTGERLRQLVFGVLLIMMGIVVWVTVWSNQLEAAVRSGFMQPTPASALLFSDKSPTTQP